mmetsp:Transcript_69872/g.116050  ORF Transcript_69872/g.116050 Transcript_69872/m.116050 type:complete len:228 (+) Transcript_69872:125-808(+)
MEWKVSVDHVDMDKIVDATTQIGILIIGRAPQDINVPALYDAIDAAIACNAPSQIIRGAQKTLDAARAVQDQVAKEAMNAAIIRAEKAAAERTEGTAAVEGKKSERRRRDQRQPLPLTTRVEYAAPQQKRKVASDRITSTPYQQAAADRNAPNHAPFLPALSSPDHPVIAVAGETDRSLRDQLTVRLPVVAKVPKQLSPSPQRKARACALSPKHPGRQKRAPGRVWK